MWLTRETEKKKAKNSAEDHSRTRAHCKDVKISRHGFSLLGNRTTKKSEKTEIAEKTEKTVKKQENEKRSFYTPHRTAWETHHAPHILWLLHYASYGGNLSLCVGTL